MRTTCLWFGAARAQNNTFPFAVAAGGQTCVGTTDRRATLDLDLHMLLTNSLILLSSWAPKQPSPATATCARLLAPTARALRIRELLLPPPPYPHYHPHPTALPQTNNPVTARVCTTTDFYFSWFRFGRAFQCCPV